METNNRVAILNMMYSYVRELPNGDIYCLNGSEVKIFNKDGEEKESTSVRLLYIKGNFLFRDSEYGEKDLHITSLLNSKELHVIEPRKTFTLSSSRPKKSADNNIVEIRGIPQKIDIIGTNFILLEYWDYTVIFDSLMNQVVYLKDIFIDNDKIQKTKDIVQKTQEGYLKLSYRYSSTNYIILDDENIKVKEIAQSNLLNGLSGIATGNKYSIVGTSWHYDGIAKSTYTIPNVLYKLAYNGNIISEKEYEDIIKPSELTNTNTLYTYAEDKGREKMGLIRDDGVELLEAKYDSIMHIGSNNYIVRFAEYHSLYNSVKGVIYDFAEIIACTTISELGITVLHMQNNQFIVVENTGRIYNLNDFTKYNDCKVCVDDNSIMKIVTPDGRRKYSYRNLVPITNMHEIAALNTKEFVNLA